MKIILKFQQVKRPYGGWKLLPHLQGQERGFKKSFHPSLNVVSYPRRKMKNLKKTIAGLSIMTLMVIMGAEEGLPQPSPKEEIARGTLGNITFYIREIEAKPSPLTILEVQVEIVNRSPRSTVLPNSVKAVVAPKEIEFSSEQKDGFSLSTEEGTLTAPISPGGSRLLIIGFQIPPERLESIIFEVQINPPDGEKKVVAWKKR
jgi:hypothetical protein